MSVEAAREYAAQARRKGELEIELRDVAARLAVLQAQVLEWFAASGVQSVRIDDSTLYLRRELWARKAEGVSHEAAAAALTTAGIGEFAEPRINVQRLSAWCRERDREGAPLPEELRGVVDVAEVFKVGHRSGA